MKRLKRKKYKPNDIRFKYLDILDSQRNKGYFRAVRKLLMLAFPGEGNVMKLYRKILRREIFEPYTVVRILMAIDKERDKVIGAVFYRHWIDLKRTTLEYIFTDVRLRGCGIGTFLYNRMKKDLIDFGSRGLFFSTEGDVGMDKCIMNGKPTYSKDWADTKIKRVRFYERLGARPLKGIRYSSPIYWDLPRGSYTNPQFLFDPLVKKARRVRVSAKLVKELVKRIMVTYYEIPKKHYQVRKILKSIKAQKLEWREPLYFKDEFKEE